MFVAYPGHRYGLHGDPMYIPAPRQRSLYKLMLKEVHAVPQVLRDTSNSHPNSRLANVDS